jgi:hypothetical protein
MVCRFNAFVLQSGLNTGAFMVMASASEFGLHFLLFPVGFFTGNLISSRVGNRVSTESMVLMGSILGRDGGNSTLRRHRGRRRRVHAKFLRGGLFSALRVARRRHDTADDHDRGAVRISDLHRGRDPVSAKTAGKDPDSRIARQITKARVLRSTWRPVAFSLLRGWRLILPHPQSVAQSHQMLGADLNSSDSGCYGRPAALKVADVCRQSVHGAIRLSSTSQTEIVIG